MDNLLSPAQLADDEYTPPARPVRGKISTQTTSKLPKHVKKRASKENPIDPDLMDITEDVPWTRPSASRTSSLRSSSSPQLREAAAVDTFERNRESNLAAPFPRNNAGHPGPQYISRGPVVDGFTQPRPEQRDDYTPPVQHVETPYLGPEYANPRDQAEALLAGRTSTCRMPTGGRSYRTQLLDSLRELGFGYHATGHPIPPLTQAEWRARGQSQNPVAVWKSYDDYGILPRWAKPSYPGFRDPRNDRFGNKHSDRSVRAYWTRYTNMCLGAEEHAIEEYCCELFREAHGISDEEFEYNKSLTLIDRKFRVVRALHRTNPVVDDWYSALPDSDREEVFDELEPDLLDGNRILGRPVRRLWKVVRVPHHVFKEGDEEPGSALDAYWDYRGSGIIPKGTQKYIAYPQREDIDGDGDLVDDPMDLEEDPQITAIRECQYQTSLRRAEQLYIYEWTKCRRAIELGLTHDEFDWYLATGKIDPAWSSLTPDGRRQVRSAAPAPPPQPPTQRPLYARPGRRARPDPPAVGRRLLPRPTEQRRQFTSQPPQQRAMHNPAGRGLYQRPGGNPPRIFNPPANLRPDGPRIREPEPHIQWILFGHNYGSYRANAINNILITAPHTPIPPRSAGDAAVYLHAYTCQGRLPSPAGYVQPSFPPVRGEEEFEEWEQWDEYLRNHERSCRSLEQNSVLRFLRNMRAGELGLTYEEFKHNRAEGRITGYAEGWNVERQLVRGASQGLERSESRWTVDARQEEARYNLPAPGERRIRRSVVRS